MNANDHNDAKGQLGAYALGALDTEDRWLVEDLLAASPAHQEELRQLRAVIAVLPFAAPAADPPERVRARLMARVEADRAAGLPTAPPRTAVRPGRRWLVPVALVALVTLVMALGGLTIGLSSAMARLDQTNSDLVTTMAELQQRLAETQQRQEALASQLDQGRRQLDEVSAQLVSSQEQIGQVHAQIAQEEYVVSFVSAPGVATRQLAPAQLQARARGEMYMYPGESSAVVLFSGLPDLAPGQVYQFWLADGDSQVAAGTFVVDQSGIARLIISAPREVNAFSQIMLTIEPDGGSMTPSDAVVLTGSL
jgi:anti-sigma-K factor RskA